MISISIWTKDVQKGNDYLDSVVIPLYQKYDIKVVSRSKKAVEFSNREFWYIIPATNFNTTFKRAQRFNIVYVDPDVDEEYINDVIRPTMLSPDSIRREIMGWNTN